MALRDAGTELRVVADGLDHPECVAWHDGLLYCGTEGGALLAVDPSSGAVRTVAQTGGSLLGMAFDQAGVCYACDPRRSRLLRIETDGTVETLVEAVAGRRLDMPNFPALADDGTLWVTDSGSGWRSDNGFLFRLRPGCDPELIDDECRQFPNGLALATDQSRLFVVESRWPGVSSYPLAGAELGQREETLPMPLTVPDGIAFDRAGRLYIGCWRPDRVYRWSGGEDLEILLDDWTGEDLTTPTNLCFGGDELRTLYLAGYSGWKVTALDGEGPGWPLPAPPSVLGGPSPP